MKSIWGSEQRFKIAPRRTRLFRNRFVTMRPTDGDDMKYLYAAWKMGAVSFEDFEIPTDASPEEFTEGFSIYADRHFDVAHTLVAKPPGREVMPVGIVFGVQPLVNKHVLWCGNFTWFPWASPRNKLEATVHFYNQMRKEWVVLGFADEKETPFFEHVCRYGVMRRIGRVFDMLNEGAAAAFQTRKPYHGGLK